MAEPRRFLAPSYPVRPASAAMLTRRIRPAGNTATNAEPLARTLLGFPNTALTQHLAEQQGVSLTRLEAGCRSSLW